MTVQWRSWVRATAIAALLVTGATQAGAQGINGGSQGLNRFGGSSVSPDNSQFVGNDYSPDYNASGWLEIDVVPKDAMIYVNGRAVGTVAELMEEDELLKLTPGTHIVVLHHPEYRTIRVEVKVATGRLYRIKQEMKPLGDNEISMIPLAATFRLFSQDLGQELKPRRANSS